MPYLNDTSDCSWNLLMKNSVYILICMLSISRSLAGSGDLESVIMLSDKLFLEGKYQQAIQEYQRAFFFSDKPQRSVLSERIGDCCLLLDDFNTARSFYDSAIAYSDKSEEKINFEFRKILCYIKEERFGDALLKLDALNVDSDSLLLQKKHLYQGICNFGAGHFELSFDCFMNSIPERDTIRRQKLQTLYKKSHKLNRPKNGVAIFLSGLLPGTGQTISGDLRNGLNSFLLLGGIASLGFITAPENLLIICPLYLKYYLGGLVHTKEIAENRRRDRRDGFYTELTRIMFD